MQPASGHVSHDERIAAVDGLRAFALLGIIVTHAAMAFLVGAPPDPLFNTFTDLDRVVDRFVDLFASGKFFAIFSFLFGLSFAIQLDRARKKGRSFSGRFVWRLAILWAIGFVHSLFFSGDILMIYALLGLLLIPFQRVSNKLLLVIACILALNVPGLIFGIARVNNPPPSVEVVQTRAELMERAKKHYEIKQSGTVSELVRINLTEANALRVRFQVLTGRLWVTFGLFLLGVYVGRMKLFEDTSEHRRVFRRIFVWAALGASGLTVATIAFPGSFRAATLSDVIGWFVASLHQIALAAFYVAAMTLLFWGRFSNAVLAWLAPLGRLGLTTYLMQSMIGITIFYGIGFGLLGRLGVASCVAVGIGIFMLQILFARAWVRYFKLGPAEWLWRSLTYLKLQPNGATMGQLGMVVRGDGWLKTEADRRTEPVQIAKESEFPRP